MSRISDIVEKSTVTSGRRKISQRQAIDQWLLDMTLGLMHTDPEKTGEMIRSILNDIGLYTGCDRVYVYAFGHNARLLTLKHAYYKEDMPEKITTLSRLEREEFKWMIETIHQFRTIKIQTPADIPPQAKALAFLMQKERSLSTLLQPIGHGTEVFGILGVDMVNKARVFSDDTIYILDRMARILGGTIMQAGSTERREMAMEQRFRTLFSAIEDVVFISTPDGRFLEINPAGAKLFGYPSVHALYQIDIGRDLYRNIADRQTYQEIMHTKGQVRDYELYLKRRTGDKLIVQETATVVRDRNGNITAYQGIMRDVTYKRQLEQQLLQAQKMESIGMLAGGIAHDFNNILTTINGYAELMQMQLDPSEKFYNNVTNIIKGVKRSEDLIRQLLAFSRRQMIEPKVIDLNKEITDLHSMLRRLISEDIRFELDLCDRATYIRADRIQLQQVLVNLVVNANHAIKKMKTGQTFQISISTQKTKLSKEFVAMNPGSREGNFVIIAVQDNGVGMDEDTRRKIFEPFFSTKGEGEGTGLGLATVYGIVKQNNGNIYVESVPGKGSTFKIYWPLTDDSDAAATRIETEIQFKQRSESVLFVEDDINVRNLACNGLRAFGYKVYEAANGVDAIEQINRHNLRDKIDILISDIVMPEMGGEALADYVSELNPSIRILLCSGFTDSRVGLDDDTRGNNHAFLPKPYTLKELEKKIRSLLDQQ
jgi:PAS domain S-box-containing protein